jgi:hypothetical protein
MGGTVCSYGIDGCVFGVNVAVHALVGCSISNAEFCNHG